jgi:hypothetical protein
MDSVLSKLAENPLLEQAISVSDESKPTTLIFPTIFLSLIAQTTPTATSSFTAKIPVKYSY